MDPRNREIGMVVGRRIRELRKSHKPKPLTQRELVIRVKEQNGKLTESMLSLIENGKQIPRINTLQKIADGLGVPLEEIHRTQDVEEEAPATLEEIQEVLVRYRPLRGNELAINRVIEQVRLWSISLGSAGKPAVTGNQDR